MVSEYVSSKNVYFYGLEGYQKFVSTLNLIANQYGNSKYTIGARHIGYNGQTATITNTTKFTSTAPWTSATSNNNNEVLGGGDMLYEYDTNSETGLVYKALGTLVAKKSSGTATAYWIGSRLYVYGSSIYYRWNGRVILDTGIVNDYVLYSYGYVDSVYTNISRSKDAAIRPIVTLKSDITSFTGLGTSDSPWVLQ